MSWKFDEKRARELFRNSGNEILLANAEAEKDKKVEDDPFYAVFDFNDIRNEILPLIAKHDADLALELLAQTRSAKLAEEMAKASQPNAKQEGGYMNFNPAQFQVQQEVALEQRFAVLAAEQNPDKAIKLIKDSLAKGISWNVLPLLQKLNKKDEKKAAALADEVVKKITDTDLTKKREDLGAAIRFLQFATNPNAPKATKEKQFKFSDAQLKSIADKLFQYIYAAVKLAGNDDGNDAGDAGLEKFVPEKVALLNKNRRSDEKSAARTKRMQQQQKLGIQIRRPRNSRRFAEMNEYEKASAYQSLATKSLRWGRSAREKNGSNKFPTRKTREKATEHTNRQKSAAPAKDANSTKPKKLIGNLNKKKTQILQLVALAMEFHKKATEKDRETAVGLMKDAKGLANEYPEDEDELNDLMEIVKGYAVVNPDEAFRIFDPIVDQINDFVQASAILSKYNKRNRNFKKGELLMKVNGYSWDGLLLFRYINQIQMLGKADLNRMSLFSDKFQRSDTRTIVKLFVAQGFLKDEKKSENEGGSGGMIFIDYYALYKLDVN